MFSKDFIAKKNKNHYGKILIYKRNSNSNNLYCFFKNDKSCEHLIDVDYRKSSMNNTVELNNIRECSKDFCEKHEFSVNDAVLKNISSILGKVKGISNEYFIPGTLKYMHFEPYYFEFESFEQELLTYKTLCNTFSHNANIQQKNQQILERPYKIFIHRTAFPLRNKSRIYKCDFEFNNIKKCKTTNRRFSYFDHRLMAFLCPKKLNETDKKSFVKGHF